MSWNRQDLERFDITTKDALRAARKISQKKNYPPGYFPIESLLGVMIDTDQEVKSASKTVGMSSHFFYEAAPTYPTRLSPLDHPALLLPRVYETQSTDRTELLRPIHIIRYVLQSGHPGIQGILGLRLYRHGQIYPETVMKAFFDHKSQLLKAA